MDTEIGCFMKPEVGYAETKIQPRVQDRGGQACQGAWGICGARPEERVGSDLRCKALLQLSYVVGTAIDSDRIKR